MVQRMAHVLVAGMVARITVSTLALALLLCSGVFSLPLQGRSASKQKFSEREISYKTADGWTIYGILTVPAVLAQGEKVAGVVLIHAPAHDRDIYGHNGYPNVREALEKENIATLRIDIRGRGKSAEPQEYHSFTPEQRASVAFDVSGAIEFLSRQESIDSSRIGVVAEVQSAEATVIGAFKDRRTRALVLLSGRLGQTAKDLIASRDDLPVLSLASKEDKIGVVDMTDVYKLSQNPASNLMVHRDIGIGNSMFITWAAKFPNEKPLESTVAEWLAAQLQASAECHEVSFQTEDGWTIYGSLRLPQQSGQASAPGVILVHSNLSDRHIFDRLEGMLAAAGLAVLNIDFRGRGKSRGKGSYFDLPQEERDKAYLDVRAGLNFLSSHREVDADRLAVVATAIGVRYALKAANSDARVKSFVMLGGLPDRAEVEKSRFPVLFVSSLGVPRIAQAFREFYTLTRDRGSYLVEHEGGALGYQILEIDEELQPLIVRWLKPQLSLP